MDKSWIKYRKDLPLPKETINKLKIWLLENAEYRKKNRERINAQRRERYKNNPDYDKDYSKKRYQKLVEGNSEQNQENPENQDS